MMKEKKSPYVLDGNKVAVRDAAGDILEMVENVLDRYGIHVPDEMIEELKADKEKTAQKKATKSKNHELEV